jgi:poly(A) polymerase
MKYKLYLVGGIIRDRLLGVKSKDFDYSVVVEDLSLHCNIAFSQLEEQLEADGFKIFLSTPACFTIRAKFPNSKEVADFVLARRETGYVAGTRTPISVLGTLDDDLERRDFTVNCLAEDVDMDYIIDPFNGKKDLMDGILRTPLDAAKSFNNDPLRILRGFRFSVTKKFSFADTVLQAIRQFDAEKMHVVSEERIREELLKMFQFDSFRAMETMFLLRKLNPFLYKFLFDRKLWLQPTIKG